MLPVGHAGETHAATARVETADATAADRKGIEDDAEATPAVARRADRSVARSRPGLGRKRPGPPDCLGVEGPTPCAGAGAIWVASQTEDDVYRIDPATNMARAVHVGNGGELCVDVHDDGVWV